MKILSATQLGETDAATIKNEPIASIDLMERAARACVKRLVKLFSMDEQILVFCGKGNNGGDGLAVTRLLLASGYSCKALVIHDTPGFSADAQMNYERLKEKFPQHLYDIYNPEDLIKAEMTESSTCVDAVLGTGINRPVDGLMAYCIDFINTHYASIISIDMPSGLFCDTDSSHLNNVVKASLVLTLQLPKLAFMMPSNGLYVKKFEILDIGLDEKTILTMPSKNYFVDLDLAALEVIARQKFSHKGTYGHALLLAGSKGKSGAALIAAKATLRSGAGLLTVNSNQETLNSLLHYLPEAMTEGNNQIDFISEIENPTSFDAIAFGPGTGVHEDTQRVLRKLLNYYRGKMVIDADGLTILSENKTWLEFLPPHCILTPHPKEFERLCGKQTNDFERLETLRQFSLRYGCIVILKGAHSAIAVPNGHVYFNSSGNAGLAKAGCGDGLTGILLGLLCRGYHPVQAAIIGTFVHGYAADLWARKKSMESLLINDVIELLPKAFKKLEDKKELLVR